MWRVVHSPTPNCAGAHSRSASRGGAAREFPERVVSASIPVARLSLSFGGKLWAALKKQIKYANLSSIALGIAVA